MSSGWLGIDRCQGIPSFLSSCCTGDERNDSCGESSNESSKKQLVLPHPGLIGRIRTSHIINSDGLGWTDVGAIDVTFEIVTSEDGEKLKFLGYVIRGVEFDNIAKVN